MFSTPSYDFALRVVIGECDTCSLVKMFTLIKKSVKILNVIIIHFSRH